MSFKIETYAVDGRIAHIASLLEDLAAVGSHKIAVDNGKARHALARYARDLKARLDDALRGLELTPMLVELITAAQAALCAERAEEAKSRREYRDRLAAERAEQQLIYGTAPVLAIAA